MALVSGLGRRGSVIESRGPSFSVKCLVRLGHDFCHQTSHALNNRRPYQAAYIFSENYHEKSLMVA